MTLVLVAEDDEDIRFIVVRVLQRAGYEVVAVADGVDGLTELRRRRPDVVITDLDMPRLGGGDMVRQAIGEGLLDGVPIVIISGAIQPGDPRVAELAVAEALRKPFVGRELLACVENVLAARS
jgi:CheY-like chemotaxis protein